MESTKPKPFVFVLMPFDEKFKDVYELGIKPACDNAGAYAERVDEQIFQDSIPERIYNQIHKSDVVVSDMTGKNVNVFYETGYAHALGKIVILITQNADDIPFDLQPYPHIIYGGKIRELIPELEKRIRWAIQHPEKKTQTSGVEFSIGGISLSGNPEIQLPIDQGSVRIIIDAHNSIEKDILKKHFKFGLIVPEKVKYIGEDVGADFSILTVYEMQDKGKIYLRDREYELLPGEWDKLDIKLFAKKDDQFQVEDRLPIVLRMLSETCVEDYPFTLVLKEESNQVNPVDLLRRKVTGL